MTIIVNRCEATSAALMPLSVLLKDSIDSSSAPRTSSQCYKIKYFQKSVSAWILFVQVGEDYRVLKLLCNYQDERYKLDTVQKRQICQFEAFQCNSNFSPAVYYGLSHVTDFNAEQQTISIERNYTFTFSQGCLPNAEYALVMRWLPTRQRLDYLLQQRKYHELNALVRFLTDRVVDIHSQLPVLCLEQGKQWGSFQQLRKKLEHNLTLAEPILDHQITSSDTEQHDPCYNRRERFASLQNTLLRAFTIERYEAYTNERVHQGNIKRCHADLKAPNIWVEETGTHDAEYIPSSTSMLLLDAIDFNKMYSIIDTLSDFATLVVDIQARTEHRYSEILAQQMISNYLDATHQNNEMCQALMHYYLVEKAYVGAALSMVYDNLPELGLEFLGVAEFWSEFLRTTSTFYYDAHKKAVAAIV